MFFCIIAYIKYIRMHNFVAVARLNIFNPIKKPSKPSNWITLGSIFYQKRRPFTFFILFHSTYVRVVKFFPNTFTATRCVSFVQKVNSFQLWNLDLDIFTKGGVDDGFKLIYWPRVPNVQQFWVQFLWMKLRKIFTILREQAFSFNGLSAFVFPQLWE